MNKYFKVTGIIVLLIGLIAGSTFVYKALLNKYNNQAQLQLEENETNLEDTDASTESSNTGDSETEASKDYAAPDFTVYDDAGNEVTLKSQKGKPVVVNFWASWCPPCKGEMPDFQKVFEESGDEVEFMMINMTDGARETKESALAHIEENGYTFPIYFDTKQDAANAYQVFSIPTTYFIDAEGNIMTYASGAIEEEDLKKAIDMLKEKE